MARTYKIKDFDHLEEIVNDELELKPTNRSGAVSNNGDGMGKIKGTETYGHVLHDCKYTEKKPGTLSVSRADWDKTVSSACRFGRKPIMVTGDASGTILVHISLDDFAEIYLNHITTLPKV